jgi:hypothetical protein
MAVTNGWGQAAKNNTNGFGKLATNNIGAGSIYENSYSGDTALIGTSAAFLYSKSSFNQAEADPTPTITGTAGGSFNADAGVVFVDTGSFNSSTGQIDLSATSIGSHIITYTVDGVQSGQSVGVESPPYTSTSSFSFDGVNDYFDTNQSLSSSYSALTLSAWVNYTSLSSYTGTIFGQWIQNNFQSPGSTIICYTVSNKIQVYLGPSAIPLTSTTVLSTGTWYNVILRFDGSTMKLYINGTEEASVSFTSINNSVQNLILGAYSNSGQTGYQSHLNGKLDEVSIWDSALSSDAITEIASGPSDLTSLTNASSSNLKAWYKMGE